MSGRAPAAAAALALLCAPAASAGRPEPVAAGRCPTAPVVLQVLGSGGPIAEDDRAGTSYLLRVDGEPRLLIDAGPGSFVRFAQAGGSVSALSGVVITHLHADHSVDLAGVLNSGSFEDRAAPLPVVGPDGADRFPSTSSFLRSLLGRGGAWGYLAGYLDGTEGKPRLDVAEVRTERGEGAPRAFDLAGGIRVTAIPVHHGDVPAFGVRVDVSGRTLVVTGDQSFLSTGFADALRGSSPDLLVAHHVIPEGEGQPRGLHRPPSSIGELAASTGARRLELSHNMRRSLDRLDEGLAAIRARYRGPVEVARDLDCLVVGARDGG